MPPEAKSASQLSSSWASKGAKKSLGLSSPFACTVSRTIDSPKVLGGVLPGVGVEGAPVFPVLTIIEFGPSEKIPAPACQIPAPLPPGTATHFALICPAVDTPMTHPCQLLKSQSDPKAA